MMKDLMMMGLMVITGLMNASFVNSQVIDPTPDISNVPGSDIDSNGCLASAGYVWCYSTESCIRTWETPCPHIIDMPQLHPDNPCSDVQCDLECLNGLRVNEQGCSMCICNENVFNGIPSDCVSWFDGCNTCSVVDGVTQVCTMMFCLTNQAPYCMLYSEGH